MRVLLVKTSSFGDIIHTFPALSDAMRIVPEVQFDWLVDQRYVDIAKLHPAVNDVVATDCKAWLAAFLLPWKRSGLDAKWHIAKTALAREYDVVVDLQGLMRVAWLLRYVSSTRIGYDWHSVREPLATLWYDRKIAVCRDWHAIERSRQLLAEALGYADALGAYGTRKLSCEHRIAPATQLPSATTTVLFAQGSRWSTKLWPLPHWQELARLCVASGLAVRVAYGNEDERERAQQIAAVDNTNIALLTKQSGAQLVSSIHSMGVVISVDSALTHIAAAVSVPNICLFGATNPHLTRPYGTQQHVIASGRSCAPCLAKDCRLRPSSSLPPPCMEDITPAQVFAKLQAVLAL